MFAQALVCNMKVEFEKDRPYWPAEFLNKLGIKLIHDIQIDGYLGKALEFHDIEDDEEFQND